MKLRIDSIGRIIKGPWESDEEAFVKKHYRFVPDEILAEHLGRGTSGVHSHMKRLRISAYRGFKYDAPVEAKAYFAGLLDGEGCIFRYANRPGCYGVYLANTDRNMVEWIRQNFGGYVVPQRKRVTRWQRIWVWRLTRKAEIAQLLKLVLPYLITKRERAEAAIQDITASFGDMEWILDQGRPIRTDEEAPRIDWSKQPSGHPPLRRPWKKKGD